MRQNDFCLACDGAGDSEVPGVADVASAGVGGGLVLGAAFAVWIEVVAGEESSVEVHDFTDAAELVAAVVEVPPGGAVVPLLALVEVAAVDVAGGGAARVAVDWFDAVE